MTEQTKLMGNPLTSHFKLSAQLSPSTDAKREYMLQVPYSMQWVTWYIQWCVQGLTFHMQLVYWTGICIILVKDISNQWNKFYSTFTRLWMLVYYLREMIHLVKVWSGMLFLIILVMWTNDGHLQDMYLLFLEGK